jgi:predicted component of type VI protein secretion system
VWHGASMLIVLHATSDGARSRRIQLRSNQVAKVGRSEWAEFSFSDDASMSDVQFEVRSTESGCIVRSLSTESPTFVNGKEIKTTTLHDGDQIKAGRTKFVVRIEGERAPPSPRVEVPPPAPSDDKAVHQSTDTRPERLSLMATCVYLEFAEETSAPAATISSPDEMIDRMAAEGKFMDALRLRAYLLTKREAVWWGYLCVREDLDDPLPSPQMVALEAAAAWVGQPDEKNRRSAEERAAAAKYSGVGATLALSAFWSDGSIAPEGNPAVPPDERLTSQGVAAALISAAYHGDSTKAISRIHAFLSRGKDIAEAKIGLPNGDFGLG